MNNLKRQIELARQSILKQKECVPYIFLEWQHLKRCEQRMLQSKADYETAKEIWDNLGK